jgi:hypothetical protein
MEFEEIHILSKLPTIDNEDQIHPDSETATKSVDELLNCMRENLRNEKISGLFYLLWSDRQLDTPADWAKVSFDENLTWLREIWDRSHAIYLLNTKKETLWEIYPWEGKYRITRSELKSPNP